MTRTGGEGTRLWKATNRGFDISPLQKTHKQLWVAAVMGELAVRICGATQSGEAAGDVADELLKTTAWRTTDFMLCVRSRTRLVPLSAITPNARHAASRTAPAGWTARWTRTSTRRREWHTRVAER